ncbi:MAG: 1-acyl-sn-glycerol-3-phosphate acyltransferase [Betaproteobacteria bacterium]|nr:1-acyl-sn-glycerol-3-phosphate acyltransferase [Betaproteobacteria bacterium]
MRDRLLLMLRVTLSFALLTACAVGMLLIAALTLFQCRRWYSERIATPCGRLVLRLWGIRLAVHRKAPFPQAQTIFISNHSSTIDLFALIALGLPNTRFFLSGYLRTLLPLGLIGYLIGVFWTVPQKYPARRMRIFRRAERILRRTGESVFLSPEGTRVTTGRIGHFNKGAFHLATVLHAPIMPIFLFIPQSINPGRGLHARSGEVQVHLRAPIDTADWRIENLEANRDRMREFYIHWQDELERR